MFSEKKSVQILASVLRAKGIRNIVFSPGSRNAPLVIELAGKEDFNTLSIPDERCAGFFAMGMAQWDRKPAVLCCTSGSAALNYAPAIAEAYYQGIPLLVITADRPNEWIDHGEGQSIRQRDVFNNFIKASYEIPQSDTSDNDLWFANRIINEALNESFSKKPGPVHINLPFSEPLYGQVDKVTRYYRNIERHESNGYLPEIILKTLGDKWGKSRRKLIICGLMYPDNEICNTLDRLSNDSSVAILTETTGNVFGSKIYPNIDRIISGLNIKEIESLQPDIIVTLGGPIVSKKIKALLREHRATEHWHIDESPDHQDVFQNLAQSIVANPNQVLNSFEINSESVEDSYALKWQQRHWKTKINHESAMENLPFCDLSVYRDVLDFIPENSVIHMANSTAVRYVQLFDPIPSSAYFCNRGTSGIDGSTSTALGSTSVNGKHNVLLSGDIGFIYDSNAFWNTPVDNLKIVVVNNDGGGIFRIIEGPDSTDQVDDYFVVKHGKTARHIAEMYGLNYHSAKNQQDLDSVLPEFFNFEKSNNGILEVFTDSNVNPTELKRYFKQLNK